MPAPPSPSSGGDASDRPLPTELENALAEAFWRDPAIREEKLHNLVQQNPAHRDALLGRIQALERAVQPEGATVPDDDRAPMEAQPDHVGAYRILDVLGEGGMGTVYLAEQRQPVRRRVALKVIKLGMDTKEVLNRFEAERQALAMMEHSCIAKVLDAGMTAESRPFFVMEYIKGNPITTYCDGARLDLDSRLRLFVRICSGVQHAHSKGIIHRDLKPSNILVSIQELDPVPKIIDFGLARATDHRLIEATMFTKQGQIIGTPEYMSPEQAGLGDLDIDTRTDVYSLGVILYELLVGELPLPSTELRRAGLLEFQRMIREVEPRKPSTRLSNLGVAPDSAKSRSTTTIGLSKRLRGDLDWIVMKALEKDRTRRYTTPLELAADIERHLACEPVLAGPPSTMYRLKKMVRRHRVPFVAAAVVFVTAIACAFVAWGFAIEAKASEKKVTEERERFDRLSTGTRLQDARSEMSELHPAWPVNLPLLNEWIRKWSVLKEDIPLVQETIADLQRQAPATIEPTAHPRYEEYLTLKDRKLPALERAMNVRLGNFSVTEPELPAATPREATRIEKLARRYVEPTRPPEAFGNEALGLTIARHAVRIATAEHAAGGTGLLGRHQAHQTLAWALFANGMDEKAKEEMSQAILTAPFLLKLRVTSDNVSLSKAIEGAGEELQKTRALVSQLAGAVEGFTTYRPRVESDRFLYGTLLRVASDLRRFFGPDGAFEQVERWQKWASHIEQWTHDHPAARVRWTDAAAAIRAADGVRASQLYAAHPIALKAQTGLVPIGMNPKTKLWEFYHLRSAIDPRTSLDASRIEIPSHEADGSIKVTKNTGIVFVLIPGGSFVMGAQKENSQKPNYDPFAIADETTHQLSIAPFFLARHELTIGQWERLSGEAAPNAYPAEFLGEPLFLPVSRKHPIENVTWTACRALFDRFRLDFPTEAQWEYGCRAGREPSHPWFPGDRPADLRNHANVLDQTARNQLPGWGGTIVPFRDRHVIHAPVGSFQANAFGLHDMHGNVQEWCRDWFLDYSLPVDPVSGERRGADKSTKVARGGSYNLPPESSRSAFRDNVTPTIPNDNRGVRAARAVIQ